MRTRGAMACHGRVGCGRHEAYGHKQCGQENECAAKTHDHHSRFGGNLDATGGRFGGIADVCPAFNWFLRRYAARR